MLPSHALKAAIWTAALCLSAPAQDGPGKDAPINQAKGMPPRATPAEYQAQVQAGTVTIAGEFKGHSVPTMQGPLSTEDYVVVETALFGPPEARTKLSADDFSLRINGKKASLPASLTGWWSGRSKIPSGSRPFQPKRNRKPA